MVSFDRSHTTSYSTSVVTICLSHAVSEIWRDENNYVATANKNWLPWQSAVIVFSTNVTSALEVFLNDMRYINPRFTYLFYLLTSDRSSTAIVLPTLKI